MIFLLAGSRCARREPSVASLAARGGELNPRLGDGLNEKGIAVVERRSGAAGWGIIRDAAPAQARLRPDRKCQARGDYTQRGSTKCQSRSAGPPRRGWGRSREASPYSDWRPPAEARKIHVVFAATRCLLRCASEPARAPMNFTTSFGLSLLGLFVLPVLVSGCLPDGRNGVRGTRRAATRPASRLTPRPRRRQ